MADVHVMPGIFRDDLAQTQGNMSGMWKAAQDANLQDVAIVGRDGRGEIQVYGSVGDIDKVVGLLMQGVHFFMGAGQIMPPDDESAG